MSLPPQPNLPCDLATQLRRDYETFAVTPLPRFLEEYVLDQYGVDLAATYAGFRIRNPFGKASGQLSNTIKQVHADAQAGLGFCVLKTMIAVDATGRQSMSDWAIPVTRMQVEPITGRSGKHGWTVSWTGRGWHDTFEKYLEFFDEALAIGAVAEMLVVPSVKYHLPGPDEDEWRVDEYEFTTRELLKVWRQHHPNEPMPLEKDFSPTLAGDERAGQKERVLEWIRKVPKLIKGDPHPQPLSRVRSVGENARLLRGRGESNLYSPPPPHTIPTPLRLSQAGEGLGESNLYSPPPPHTIPTPLRLSQAGEGLGVSNLYSPLPPHTIPTPLRLSQAGEGLGVRVGLKLFNAVFEDEFQLDLLRAAIDEAENGIRADYLIYGNRLFDPNREFAGKHGIAYGGPDLSDRNLKVLTWLREREARGEFRNPVQPISATGDIDSGRKAMEYERLGCENFQMHTLFQLPDSCFAKKDGTRSEKAMHHLLFHPETGYLAWKLSSSTQS